MTKKRGRHLIKVGEEIPFIPMRRIRRIGLGIRKGVKVAFNVVALKNSSCWAIALDFFDPTDEKIELRVVLNECLEEDNLSRDLLVSARDALSDMTAVLEAVLTQTVEYIRLTYDADLKEIQVEVKIEISYFTGSVRLGERARKVFVFD